MLRGQQLSPNSSSPMGSKRPSAQQSINAMMQNVNARGKI
jgi:hypothetical protein